MKFWRKFLWVNSKNRTPKGKIYWQRKPRIDLRKSDLARLDVIPEYPYLYSVEVLPESKKLIVTFKRDEIRRES